VECWEISDLLPDQTLRQRSLKGPTIMRMANDDLQGVDLLTWPEPTPLWPPPRGSVHSQGFDLSSSKNLFSINSGLINFKVNSRSSSTYDDDDDDGQYIFSAENGDNWFYFEDQTSYDDDSRRFSTQQCAKAKTDGPPLTISTRSATDTTLTQFKYKGTPQHKVLHSGRCEFTGLVTESSNFNGGRRLRNQEL